MLLKTLYQEKKYILNWNLDAFHVSELLFFGKTRYIVPWREGLLIYCIMVNVN